MKNPFLNAKTLSANPCERQQRGHGCVHACVHTCINLPYGVSGTPYDTLLYGMASPSHTLQYGTVQYACWYSEIQCTVPYTHAYVCGFANTLSVYISRLKRC
jgi:hypothetical protein